MNDANQCLCALLSALLITGSPRDVQVRACSPSRTPQQGVVIDSAEREREGSTADVSHISGGSFSPELHHLEGQGLVMRLRLKTPFILSERLSQGIIGGLADLPEAPATCHVEMFQDLGTIAT